MIGRLTGWLRAQPHIGIIALIVTGTVVALLSYGRPPICTCGTIRLWEGAVNSPENSQQIADWYTLSHFTHGILFYGLFWLVLRSMRFETRLILAVAVEAGWELLENSSFIIDRYRQATIALGYTGDSVLNSVSDIAFMTLGFLLARRAPLWLSVTLVLFCELFALWMIRDNLTLNIVMLVWPIQAIKQWQGG